MEYNYNSNNLRVIRDLIQKALTEEEFNDLVSYDFHEVNKQFTNGQKQSQRIRILIDYANKHRKIDKLLESIKTENELVYNEFFDRIFETTQLKKSTEQEDQGINQLR